MIHTYIRQYSSDVQYLSIYQLLQYNFQYRDNDMVQLDLNFMNTRVCNSARTT